MDFDAELLASQLLRAFRGGRSQLVWSRRLGYRGNVAATWESGRRFPTAAVALDAAAHAGHDVLGALRALHASPPPWLTDASPEVIARLLSDLRGEIPIVEVAARAGRSRYAVARWLSGEAEPRLPDFLRLVEALTFRGLDLVAAFADPAGLPACSEAWKRLQAGRTASRADPRTFAVRMALELGAYRDAPSIAQLVVSTGFSEEQVRDALRFLLDAAAVRVVRGRYEPLDSSLLDPAATRTNRVFWAEEAARRLTSDVPGVFGFELFPVSEEAWQRIEEMERAHFRAIRAVVAESTRNDRVAVLNHQLFGLQGRPC